MSSSYKSEADDASSSLSSPSAARGTTTPTSAESLTSSQMFAAPPAAPALTTSAAEVAPIAPATRFQVLNLVPLTNRRKKNHVPTTNRIRVACIPCKLDKQKCDAPRPCTRCVMKNKVHLCIDRAADSILAADEPLVSSAASSSDPGALLDVIQKSRKPLTAEQGASLVAEVQKQRKTYRTKRKRATGADSVTSGENDSSRVEATTKKVRRNSISGSQTSEEDSGVDIFKKMFSILLKPMIQSIAETKSPFFIQDIITRNPRLWRGVMTKLHSMFPEPEVLELREFMIKSAASAAATPEASRQMVELFSQIRPFQVQTPVVLKSESLNLPSEAFSVIEDLFHVKCVEDTDLAVVYLQNYVNNEDIVEVEIRYNENIERLYDRTVDSFGHGLDPADGTPKTAFWMRVLSNKSLRTVSRFEFAFCMREESFFTDTVEIVRPDGSILRAFMAVIGGYQHEPNHSEPRSSFLVYAFKPCSATFDPDKFKKPAQ